MASGRIYGTELCIGTLCKIMSVYAADHVTEDNLMYGQDASYGILGLGPLSPIWYTLADDTNKAVYSIALARLADSELRGASAATSNITLGGAADTTYYADKPSVNITTDAPNNVSYTIQNFTFGIVYEVNGTDSSENFANLDVKSGANVAVFDIASQGLVLPSAIWTQFKTLIEYVTSN